MKSFGANFPTVSRHLDRILLCISRIISMALDFTRIAKIHSPSVALDVSLSASYEAQTIRMGTIGTVRIYLAH